MLKSLKLFFMMVFLGASFSVVLPAETVESVTSTTKEAPVKTNITIFCEPLEEERSFSYYATPKEEGADKRTKQVHEKQDAYNIIFNKLVDALKSIEVSVDGSPDVFSPAFRDSLAVYKSSIDAVLSADARIVGAGPNFEAFFSKTVDPIRKEITALADTLESLRTNVDAFSKTQVTDQMEEDLTTSVAVSMIDLNEQIRPMRKQKGRRLSDFDVSQDSSDEQKTLEERIISTFKQVKELAKKLNGMFEEKTFKELVERKRKELEDQGKLAEAYSSAWRQRSSSSSSSSWRSGGSSWSPSSYGSGYGSGYGSSSGYGSGGYGSGYGSGGYGSSSGYGSGGYGSSEHDSDTGDDSSGDHDGKIKAGDKKEDDKDKKDDVYRKDSKSGKAKDKEKFNQALQALKKMFDSLITSYYGYAEFANKFPNMAKKFKKAREALDELDDTTDKKEFDAYDAFCKKHISALLRCAPFAVRSSKNENALKEIIGGMESHDITKAANSDVISDMERFLRQEQVVKNGMDAAKMLVNRSTAQQSAIDEALDTVTKVEAFIPGKTLKAFDALRNPAQAVAPSASASMQTPAATAPVAGQIAPPVRVGAPAVVAGQVMPPQPGRRYWYRKSKMPVAPRPGQSGFIGPIQWAPPVGGVPGGSKLTPFNVAIHELDVVLNPAKVYESHSAFLEALARGLRNFTGLAKTRRERRRLDQLRLDIFNRYPTLVLPRIGPDLNDEDRANLAYINNFIGVVPSTSSSSASSDSSSEPGTPLSRTSTAVFSDVAGSDTSSN